MNDKLSVVSPASVATIDSGRQRVVEHLERLLAHAKEGNINGFVIVTDEPGYVGWGKTNVSFPMALGMLARCAHHINKGWDEYREET